MAQIYNDPAAFKDDATEGYVAAYGRYVAKVEGASGVMRAGGPRDGKVSVIVGGGSGHYPAFCGVVGPGMADGAVIGDVFTSPSAEQAYRVGLAVDGGAGVLFSFGNYAGDVLNFRAGEDRLKADGIDARTVLVTDDVASAGPDEAAKRRGIAGGVCVFKTAGAAADRGDSLDDVERLARKCNDRTRSFGVAFAGCTFPGQTEPLFTVEPGQMELGLGIHGEPGIRTVQRMSARELAATLLEPLLAERPDGAEKVAVLLNGLGATKYEELFVLAKDVLPALEAAGLEVVLPEVGEFVTSLDMAGCSLTVAYLDDELEELWRAPADTPTFRRAGTAVPLAGRRREQSARQATPETATPVAESSEESRRAAGTVRAALAAMLEVCRDNEQEFARLDAVAGDGDHGAGMLRGVRAAAEAAHAADGGVATGLRSAGAAWADRAGGTSGVLWGALLESLAKSLGDTEPVTGERLATAIRTGGEVLAERGGASLGDKTMLDCLLPFGDALAEQVGAGSRLPAAWRAASGIATESARATADLVAKVGRSRPLAERSLGTPDPGATSMAMCIAALCDVMERECGDGAGS